MKLEDFVRKNRDEFDVYTPTSQLWHKISAQQKAAPKLMPLRRLWQVAASVALLVGCLMYGFHLWEQDKLKKSFVEHKNHELLEAEAFYEREIAFKLAAIRQYDVQDEMLYEDFRKELTELDSAYKNLSEELATQSSQEQIVGAMVENLQIRLELLNRQLSIVQQIQKIKNNPKNESIDL